MTTTSLVIPVWNNVGLTQQLLDVLCEFTPSSELIIVDNCSTDGTLEYVKGLKESHPELLIVAPRLTYNMGFAKAVNVGLRIASGDVIIVLSNDVTIVTLDWLEDLKRTVEENPKALCGPMIIATNTWTQKADGECIPYQAGWCLAFNRQFLKDVGYLDENYELFYEDVDISYRAMLAGYSLVEIPELGLFHLGGGSGRLLEKPMRLCLQSRRQFAKKFQIEFAPHWSEIEFPEEGHFKIERRGGELPD